MGQPLTTYIADAASLLRDWGFQFTTQARLQRWINTGRRQVAKHSGCLRALVPGTAPAGSPASPGTMIPGGFSPGSAPNSGFTTLPGVERYSFSFANSFLKAQNAGYSQINDVFGVAVSWGSARPMLQWMPWDDMQAYARSYSSLVTSYPSIWSTFGSGTSSQVYLWPPPSAALEMEWDCTCTPIDLNSNDDFDALPDSFVSGVKFYAAAMAMLGSFRYGTADSLFKLYLASIEADISASEGGKIPNYYTALAMS